MPEEEKIVFSSAKPPEAFNFEAKNKLQEWKTWNRQFRWFATSSGLNKQSAEVQVSTFMNCLGKSVVPLFESFNLTEEEEGSLETIKKKFEREAVSVQNTSRNYQTVQKF
jgi:hypothetical protein